MNQETAPFRAGAGNAAVNGKGGYAGPPDDDEEAINPASSSPLSSNTSG